MDPALRYRPAILMGLALLATLTYLPSLSLPLLSDDYTQILLGRRYGPPSGWAELALDPMYSCRATSIVLTYWTEQLFGIPAAVLNGSSLILHLVNTFLVFALGRWRIIGWRVSAAAAAFFAVYEGHQEAVMWYAALPELLVVAFSLLTILAWLRWRESGRDLNGYYVATLLCFVLALLSKESAVAVIPLLILVEWAEETPYRETIRATLPLAVVGILYAWLIFTARSYHFHFHDGTFSIGAPVLRNLMNSAARLFWIWGLVGLFVLLMVKTARAFRLLAVAAAWILITLLPYCFLTYMPYVPSRHTYFASVGLAWVVGAGFLGCGRWTGPSNRLAVLTMAALVLAHNWYFIWTKKHQQFLRRASPNTALIDFATASDGPLRVKCFPFGREGAMAAIAVGSPDRLASAAWDPAAPRGGEGVFCDESRP